MAYEITPQKTKFERGFASDQELIQWFHQNEQINGVAFVGRSNVGKSSLINTFFGKDTARVSNTPGRTREINLFSFELSNKGIPLPGKNKFYLFDLPGYGHAEVSKEMSKNWERLMSAFFESAQGQLLVFNIQDARHPNQDSDQEFHYFLKHFTFNVQLIFNKMDKLKTQKERSSLDKLKPVLSKEYKWVKAMFFTSAEKKTGLQPVKESLINFLLLRNDFLKSQDLPAPKKT